MFSPIYWALVGIVLAIAGFFIPADVFAIAFYISLWLLWFGVAIYMNEKEGAARYSDSLQNNQDTTEHSLTVVAINLDLDDDESDTQDHTSDME